MNKRGLHTYIIAAFGRLFVFCLLSLALVFPVFSLPELPGEELSDERIHRSRTQRSTPPGAVGIADWRSGIDEVSLNDGQQERSWLERAMDTWHTPPLHVQMAADEVIIPFGKGGLFVPRYTATNAEPDIEVYDLDGNRLISSEPGRTILLEPGEYRVMLGSGAFSQRIVKNARVEEGRTLPVIPDWSGLIIDVVDEQGIILKGEYELVRIDEFDPYGRGYGASIELGETVRAWILKPGIYKILGVGEAYNTLTNFVTVRLLPGELTTFLLIQDPDDFRIRGGGTIHLTPSTRLTSNWRAGINIGTNVQYNTEIDHQAEMDIGANTFTMGLLFDAWLLYRKRPVEWSTRLRLDEGINITDRSFENMISNPDRLLMSSIFIWRVLNWFGPYARSEFNTKLFDTKIRRNKDDWFTFVDHNYFFDEAAGTDTSLTFMVEPALSPLTVEVGLGVSADMTTQRYFELRARLGFGGAYSRYNDRHRVIESNRVRYRSDDSLVQKDIVHRGIVLYPEDKINIFEIGPQSSVSAMVRLGTFASAEGELKVFAPLLPEQRLHRPDVEFGGTLSWRLSRILNLDYTYRQTLKRPTELDVPIHTSSHGIWLRLHYSTR